MVKRRERTELARIGMAAAEADEAVSKFWADAEKSFSGDEVRPLDHAAYDARHALYDHLLTEYGITTAEARRIAAVLL